MRRRRWLTGALAGVVGFGGAAPSCHDGADLLAVAAPAVESPTPPPEAPRDPVPPLPPLPALPPPGPLTGLVVYVSPGHGRLIHLAADNRTAAAWGYQRATQNGVHEDLWTHAFCADLLAPALEAAGATVLSLRERDRHPEVVVADDAQAAADCVAGADGSTCPFVATHAGAPQEDPLAWGAGARQLPADGWARWRVAAPAAGRWYLYTRWSEAPTLDPAASYVVVAGGATRRVDVDQRVHGGAWWPLGAWDLAAGDVVEVTLRGSGAGALSADAVRLGGGTFTLDDPDLGTAAPVPYYQVAASQHLPQLGGPESLLWLPDGARISDMRFRARWTSWAHPEGEDAVFLSVHTNAGSSRGTLIFYGHDTDAVPPVPAREGSRSLAGALVSELRTRLRTVDSRWPIAPARVGNYSEISPFWNEVDGALVELGFHDSPTDARRLRDPAFQQAAAEAITAAVAAWRADRSAAAGAP